MNTTRIAFGLFNQTDKLTHPIRYANIFHSRYHFTIPQALYESYSYSIDSKRFIRYMYFMLIYACLYIYTFINAYLYIHTHICINTYVLYTCPVFLSLPVWILPIV